jgi:uracil phosphoribosyltransferase
MSDGETETETETETESAVDVHAATSMTTASSTATDFGLHFKLMRRTDQIHELQTLIRDAETTRPHFKFVADRLIRMVIEEGLNQLPHIKTEVVTPTGCTYKGLRYDKGNCGVSIVRSGEAMEKALQDCCRSMRIGKILVDSDPETHEARVIFAKFPSDIAERKVLLLYPIMSSGNKVCRAMHVLKDHRVSEVDMLLESKIKVGLFLLPDKCKRNSLSLGQYLPTLS